MSKITLISLMLPLVLLFGGSSGNYAAQSTHKTAETPTGTLQKMIVESGSVTMKFDLNRLNGIRSVAAMPATARFAAAADSFFSILVFNDLLRGPESGSITLVPQGQAVPALP